MLRLIRQSPRPLPVLPETEAAHDLVSPLVESVVCDTHSACVLTAAVASIMNRLHDASVVSSEADLAPILPRDPTAMIAFRRFTAEGRMTPHTLGCVISYFAELESARHMTGRYFADARLIGPERAAVLHKLTLAAAWRAACRGGAGAIAALDHEFEEILPGLYNLNVGILSRLLTSAAAGEVPLLDEKGQVFFPDLPQRRRSARRVLNEAAMLQYNGRAIRAIVRDVSEGGLGLIQVAPIEAGQIADVVLSSGRRMTGSVIWYRKGRAGLKFARQLTPNDPLLRG
jgi:hypothetical protein